MDESWTVKSSISIWLWGKLDGSWMIKSYGNTWLYHPTFIQLGRPTSIQLGHLTSIQLGRPTSIQLPSKLDGAGTRNNLWIYSYFLWRNVQKLDGGEQGITYEYIVTFITVTFAAIGQHSLLWPEAATFLIEVTKNLWKKCITTVCLH